MKTILQKHTSKFVAGLFNSLGIIACVSVTACGDKDKQTGAQVEKLKNDLKDKYKLSNEDAEKISKSLKSEDAEKIADFLSKNKKGINKLTEDDLKTIFKDTNKVNDVASKLNIKQSTSNPDDEEEKKKINEWLVKLKGFKNTNFDNLDNDLKGKVAQKFIDSKVNINNDSEISAKLGDFVNKVLKEKEESKVVLKAEGKGEVSITSVVSKEVKKFVFDKVEDFQSFVEALKDKEVVEGNEEWSLKFDSENVKICGHKDGFDFTSDFENFVKYFVLLSEVDGFKLPKLSLKVDSGSFYLNEVDCTGVDFCKKEEFWKLVKDNTTIFKIENNKFKIEKNGTGDTETVKIDNFETFLNWSEVVKGGDKKFVDDSGWGEIFELEEVSTDNDQHGDSNSKKEKTFKWISSGKYSLDGNEKNITLESLKELVEALNKESYKIVCSGDDKKIFKLEFKGKNVMICDVQSGFEVLNNVSNFKDFLGYIKVLKDKEIIDKDFVFNIKSDCDSSGKVSINTNDVATDLAGKKEFWDAVKTYKGLFGEGDLNVEVGVDAITVENKKYKGKIGNIELNFVIFEGEGGSEEVTTDWKGIFKKKD